MVVPGASITAFERIFEEERARLEAAERKKQQRIAGVSRWVRT